MAWRPQTFASMKWGRSTRSSTSSASVVGLELLGRPRVLASPVTDGIGFVECRHGRLPVPVPAALAVLAERGVAISQCDEPHELVTPTGAALLTELAESFAPLAGFTPQRVGLGLGSRKNVSRPNMLRVLLGEDRRHRPRLGARYRRRARDQPGRHQPRGAGRFRAASPGERCPRRLLHADPDEEEPAGGDAERAVRAEKADELTALILRETTAFGVRQTSAARRKLHRQVEEVATPFGPVAVKLGLLDGEIVHRAPEYEACRQAAERAGAAAGGL